MLYYNIHNISSVFSVFVITFVILFILKLPAIVPPETNCGSLSFLIVLACISTTVLFTLEYMIALFLIRLS